MGALHSPDHVDHVHRQADSAGLVAEAPGDGLADPPGGVGGEFEALAPVKFLNGADQAEVAFLNEVEDVEAAAGVALGDGNDESQVGADELHLRLIGEVGFPEQLGPLGGTQFGLGIEALLGAAALFDGSGEADLIVGV